MLASIAFRSSGYSVFWFVMIHYVQYGPSLVYGGTICGTVDQRGSVPKRIITRQTTVGHSSLSPNHGPHFEVDAVPARDLQVLVVLHALQTDITNQFPSSTFVFVRRKPQKPGLRTILRHLPTHKNTNKTFPEFLCGSPTQPSFIRHTAPRF